MKPISGCVRKSHGLVPVVVTSLEQVVRTVTDLLHLFQ